MKKHYVNVAVVLSALLLIISLMADIGVTYFFYDHVMDEIRNTISRCVDGFDVFERRNRFFGKDTEYSDSDYTIAYYYGLAKTYCYLGEEIGVYSGPVPNFIILERYRDNSSYDISDYRIIPVVSDLELDPLVYDDEDYEEDDYVEDDYEEDDYEEEDPRFTYEEEKIYFFDETEINESEFICPIEDFELNAVCDDAYFYDGVIKYKGRGGKYYEYKIGYVQDADKEKAVSFDEWSSGYEVCAEYLRNDNGSEYKRELNHKAAVLTGGYFFGYDSFFDNFKNNTFKVITDQNRTRIGRMIEDNYRNSGITFVYRPLDIIFRHYGYIYALILIIWAVIEALMILVVNRLYHYRMAYEQRQKNLTRSVAHDLKTPLAIVKSYTENWNTIKESERDEYTQKMVEEVDSMTKMINNLLNMTRLDSGSRELKLEEVELYSLTESVCKQMKDMITERGLDLKITSDQPDGEYKVMADLELIRTVINNFVSNAVKYSDKKIRIALSTSKNRVCFDITNDGKKLTKKEQKKVWELFYKGDKSRSERLGSNGVGLAINKSILELHKAKYGCKSNDEGTTFSFTMKRKV